jgi:hypothetical protein
MICAPVVRYKRSYLILFYLCKIFVALCVNESIQEAIIGPDSLMRAQGLGLPLITPHHARASSLNYDDYPMAWSRWRNVHWTIKGPSVVMREGSTIHCKIVYWFLQHVRQIKAEFLNVIGTKVLRVSSLLFIVTSTNEFYPPPPPPPHSPSKSGWKLVCNVNIINRNPKYENSQDYAQKPQRNCTFMNSA